MKKELAEDYFYISPEYHGMIYRENQNLNGIILKILDARTRGQALIPNDIYESIVEHLNLYTE